jgi:hypothetical protein
LFCHLHPDCQDRELVDFTGAGPDGGAAGTDLAGGTAIVAAGDADGNASGGTDA